MSSGSIEVETVTHRGMAYTVAICDPKAEWGDKKGKFHIDTELVINTGYYSSLAEAKLKVNQKIDAWRDSNPETLAGWLDLLEQCMVWSGYEDCDFDRDEAGKVLLKFKNNVEKGAL